VISTKRSQRRRTGGFTIVELLIAGSVLAIIMTFMLDSLTIWWCW